MKNLIVLFLGIVVFLLSCDQVKTFEIPEEKLSYDQCVIPSRIGDIVSIQFISDLFGIPKEGIDIHENVKSDSKVSSLILWNETIYDSNKGFYIVLLSNNNADYGVEFVKDYLKVLRVKGESDGTGGSFKYQDWPDIGSEAVFSSESKTYCWQIHDCILFKIVFNTSHSSNEQHNFATHMAHHLNERYYHYLRAKNLISF